MAKLTKCPSDSIRAPLPVISFAHSPKGKLMILIDGYTFKLNKESKATKYWVCIVNGCSSKVHTVLDDQLSKLIDKHSHPTEKVMIEVREFHEKIKQRAMNKTTPVPHIYEEECARMMLSIASINILLSERQMSQIFN